MTAIETHTTTLTCDHDGCAKKLSYNDIPSNARFHARHDGWVSILNTQEEKNRRMDFCPDHIGDAKEYGVCGESWYEFVKEGVTTHFCNLPMGHSDKCRCQHCGLVRGETGDKNASKKGE